MKWKTLTNTVVSRKFCFCSFRWENSKRTNYLAHFFSYGNDIRVTNLRAVWDMCLSCTSEHFPVLCPLSLSPSHLLSKDTNLKKLTHYRNPLEFFFPPSPTQIATAWSWREVKILDEWQVPRLLKSAIQWPCRDRRKGTDPLISQLGAAQTEQSCFKMAEEG